MKSRFDYDVVVIGSGEAGRRAALTVAGAGLRTAIVEADKFGGSSLNYSDVPMGAMIHTMQLYRQAVEGAHLGLSSTTLRYNFPTMLNWKNTAIRHAKNGTRQVLEEAKIDLIQGFGRFISKYELSVGEKTIKAKKFLIATGASTADTGIKIAEDVEFLLPTTALEIARPPRSIFIVGGGATGCEFAQYFAALGTQVVIADIAGRLLPREDEEVGQVIDDLFSHEHIKILTQSRVVALERDGAHTRAIFLRDGQERSVKIDAVLLCTGHAPQCDLGLENVGVKFNHNGILTDEKMRTSAKHIFAAGDVVGKHMSSQEKALREADVAALHLLGKSKATAEYADLIRITNLYPEIAQVGMTEDDCLRRDRKILKAIVPAGESQKAAKTGFYGGFVKLICSKKDKRVLGGTVMLPNGSALAGEIAIAVRYMMTADELGNASHPVGEWNELLKLACQRI
ncbi:NAD(P)/FAD-dependent oxidoreductase [Candidatus Saccharibacteria bacterium]|nr:NAD(P)/FAD-dependent oxidoreductase [Candidatus Saccharibacteria bacterium]